ncbi:hypothetical protein FHR53_003352 [Xanthomonas arboricola]|uniref:zinc ribbon domain-containing protein n=1 Tax=Xanthomonas sp. NCPPB 1068 TaxID=487525 RepID=UPI0015CD2B56
MSMRTCKECEAKISTTAVACPKCGAKPKKTSGCAIVIAAFIGLMFFSAILRGCSDSPSTPLTTTPISNAAQSASPTPAKADPAALLDQSRTTVDSIESRLKENADRLKKYYGTMDQVKQATADLIELAAVKELYKHSRIKEEKSLVSRADSLTAKVSQQRRSLYASTAEEIFVKNGMDVKITASGAKKDQLRLRYVLMSQPLVYKFQNEMEMDDQARAFGFKKIIYTDGYDETWTVDL